MMPEDKNRIAYGPRALGLAIIVLGLVNLAWGTFDAGQPVPEGFPDRTVLAYASAAFMLIAGAAIEWRRTVTLTAVAWVVAESLERAGGG